MVHCMNCSLYWECEKNTDRILELLHETEWRNLLIASKELEYRQNKISEMASQCLGYGG